VGLRRLDAAIEAHKRRQRLSRKLSLLRQKHGEVRQQGV
jgi:hypothetical protein